MSAALDHRQEYAFAELLARSDGAPPLDEAVAVISAEERPDLSSDAVLLALDALARPIHLPPGASPFEQVARLKLHLFDGLGFSGDTERYDHPDNSVLSRVLQRRRGLPILLSVLTIEVGRRLGIALHGVSFPAHFIVGCEATEPRFFIDPFHDGLVLRDDELRLRLRRIAGASDVEPETWARFTGRAATTTILRRINANLKRAWLRRGQHAAALRSIERNLAMFPDDLTEHRDRGLCLVRIGREREGYASLRHYIDGEPEAWDRGYLESLISQG